MTVKHFSRVDVRAYLHFGVRGSDHSVPVHVAPSQAAVAAAAWSGHSARRSVPL